MRAQRAHKPFAPLPVAPQVINADVPKRDYWQVVIGSAAVTQQLSTVIAAVAVPVHLRQHTFSAEQLLAVSALLLVVGGWRRGTTGALEGLGAAPAGHHPQPAHGRAMHAKRGLLNSHACTQPSQRASVTCRLLRTPPPQAMLCAVPLLGDSWAALW